MSCPLLDEHLRPDLDAETRARLTRHAQTCEDCRRRLAAVAQMQQVLRADPPVLPPSVAANWWRAVESARAPQQDFGLRMGAAVGLAGAALVLVVAFLSRPQLAPATLVSGSAKLLNAPTTVAAGADVPLNVWVRIAPASVVRARALEFSAETTMALWVPIDIEQPMRIAYGTFSVELETPDLTEVIRTPAGGVVFGSGRFTTTVDGERTTVRSHRGRADLQSETTDSKTDRKARVMDGEQATMARVERPPASAAPETPRSTGAAVRRPKDVEGRRPPSSRRVEPRAERFVPQARALMAEADAHRRRGAIARRRTPLSPSGRAPRGRRLSGGSAASSLGLARRPEASRPSYRPSSGSEASIR